MFTYILLDNSFLLCYTIYSERHGEGLGGTGSHWHPDCFNSGNSFFIGDFLFGRHEVETDTADCEVLTKYVKDGEGCYISFRNDEVHGDCFIKYEMWRELSEGDWVEIEIRKLENYLKSWNEYEIVGLA